MKQDTLEKLGALVRDYSRALRKIEIKYSSRVYRENDWEPCVEIKCSYDDKTVFEVDGGNLEEAINLAFDKLID